MQGELCTALAINNPSRANFVPHTRWMRSQSTQPHTKCRRCGGCRSIRRAWLRCPWAVAGLAGLRNDTPSHTSATKHHCCVGRRRDRRARPYRWGQRSQAAVPVGGGGAWPRCRWAAAGPGRASRSTTPSRQARVWRSRGRATAHRHTQRPGPTTRPSRRPKQHNTRHRNTAPGIQKTDIRIGCRPVVELGGFEPPTFSLRTRRATNCAIAPRTQTA